MNRSANEDQACTPLEGSGDAADDFSTRPSDDDSRTAGREEISLDPPSAEAWEEFRAEAHRILEETIEQLRTVRDRAAWQPMPAAIEQAIAEAPSPQGERSLGAVYAEVASRILPYTSANRHPRAWGWVRGQGTAEAMLGDMIASAANAHVGGGATAPVLAEETVLRWLAEALGMQQQGERPGPSGILTSGATMANLLGLAVARHARAPFNVNVEGLSGQPRLLLYASTETHGWLHKTAALLGFGTSSLRLLPADAQGTIDLTALGAQIVRDREDGYFPLAVIANAGTVNTGAFDDMVAIRDLCSRENLWMHVDGAFGALLKLSSTHRHLVAGLELADSVAFDLHKWMYLPFETGCLLVRDRKAHEAAFATQQPYMERAEKGMLAGPLSFSDRGIESSRSFKALRVWMQLSVHGFEKHARLIDQNMVQAAYLESRINAYDNLELLAPRTSNILCFRFRPQLLSATVVVTEAAQHDWLNRLNREILVALQRGGRFIVSGTTLASGVFALRMALTNHRTRKRDLEQLVACIIESGARLSSTV
jgi:aromatic-L-amino-acid decarboxylase